MPKPKRKPSERRTPETTPQPPRDRLAEIRAEIQDVQQQIEAQRQGRVIRTAADFQARERAIVALTNRLSALLLAEATQAALDDAENRRQARPLAQGAGHTLKDQGRRDVTLRTTCGQVIVRATYFSRNCDRSKPGKGMYPMLLLWGVQDRCTAAVVSEISNWWRCSVRWKRSSRCCPTGDNHWTSRPFERSLIGLPHGPEPPSAWGT